HGLNERAMGSQSFSSKRQQPLSHGFDVCSFVYVLNKNTCSTQRQTEFFVAALSRRFNRFRLLVEISEQTVVGSANVARVRRQRGDEFLRITKAEAPRNKRTGFFGLSHRVRLQPMLHLQPV